MSDLQDELQHKLSADSDQANQKNKAQMRVGELNGILGTVTYAAASHIRNHIYTVTYTIAISVLSHITTIITRAEMMFFKIQFNLLQRSCRDDHQLLTPQYLRVQNEEDPAAGERTKAEQRGPGRQGRRGEVFFLLIIIPTSYPQLLFTLIPLLYCLLIKQNKEYIESIFR